MVTHTTPCVSNSTAYLALQQIPKWVKMEKSSAAKFPESAFSFIVYSFAWSWSFYIVTTHPKRLFSNLASHWSGMLTDNMFLV